MSDIREILRRGLGDYEEPTDGYERVLDRLDRRRRNQRLAAAALGIVVFVVVAVGLATVLTLDGPRQPANRTTQVDEPGPQPWADVLLIDVSTGERRSGPELGPAVSSLAVSPDGTKLAYILERASEPDLVAVADVDGSNVRIFPSTEAPDGPKSPSWSPDGSTIVYQGKGLTRKVNGDLFLLDVASGRVRQLTDLEPVPGDFPIMSPAFDPVGDAVLFTMPTSTSPPRLHLWSVPVTGGDPSLVRRNTGLVDASPDGARISFVDVLRITEGEFITGDLWIADADGSDAQRLVDARVSTSRWSPDAARILYADEELDAMMIVDLATGETVQVPWAAGGADWFDDGTVIVDAR